MFLMVDSVARSEYLHKFRGNHQMPTCRSQERGHWHVLHAGAEVETVHGSHHAMASNARCIAKLPLDGH